MFWGFFIPLLISIALAVVSYLLMPKPPKPGGTVELPTFEEGQPIQVGFGTYEVAPQLIWPSSRDTMLTTQGAGGRWNLSWAECYGWGPIQMLVGTRWDEDQMVKTSVVYDPAVDMFGRVVIPGIGVSNSGSYAFYFGANNSRVDDHIKSLIFKEDASNRRIPLYRHLAYGVYIKARVGFSPTIPNGKIKLIRVPQCPIDETGAAGMKSTFRMGGGQANPIHVLAEWYTNDLWGAGVSVDEIDWDSWNAAAEVCANEGRMISGVLTSTDQFRNLVNTIMSHIDALMIERDGKAVIKMLRYDYVPATVPVVPSGDIVDTPDVEDGDAEQVFNYIGVMYTDESKRYQQLTVPVTDVPNLLATSSSKRTTLELLFYTTADRARSVGEAKAQQLLIARDPLEMTVRRRSAYAIEEGDVVRFDRASAGLTTNRVFRVMKISRSNSGKKFAKLSCIEEVGDIAHALTQETGGGEGGVEGPLWPSTPLDYELPLELPYEFNQDADVQMSFLANREDGGYVDFELWQDSGPGFEKVSSMGKFVFAGAGGYPVGGLDVDDTGFVITTPKLAFDWEELLAGAPSVDRAHLFLRSRLAVLCPNPAISPLTHEIVAFQTIAVETTDPDTGEPASYRLSGIVRRLFDTQRMSGNVQVFILKDGVVPFIAGPRIDWFDGQVVSFKAVPYSGSSRADFDLMNSRTLILKERSRRPYAVENLAIDGDGSMPRYTEMVSARLSWTARNRLAGAGIDDSFANNAGVEATTDFVVRLFDDSDTQIGGDNIVAASHTFTDGYGVDRQYLDFTIASGGFAHIKAKVNARLAGTRESLDEFDLQELTVRRLA